MLQVAYTVDETIQQGTYNILIKNIQFETNGGNMIDEPSLVLSAEVNRWGVGNEPVHFFVPIVYAKYQNKVWIISF